MSCWSSAVARSLQILIKLVFMAANPTTPQKDASSQHQEPATGNAIKDPKDWKTGDEPMTGAQRSYLQTLSGEAHEPPPEDLTKAEASEKIEELQHKTKRGERRP
jgi:hypothetical protein